jgi:phosphatidyl-myo-inositol alpha-mannosyltransferase
MKIALIFFTLPEPGRKLGGVEVAVHRLANALVEERHEVTVFSLSYPPQDAHYKHHLLFQGSSFLKRSKVFRLFIFPFLLNFFDFIQFDIVHFHGDEWFYFKRRIPSIRTMHGSALFEAESATSLRRKILQYLVYPLEHLSVQLATLSVAIGHKTANLYNIKSMIDNGVNLDLFRPGPKTKNPSLVFIGTWLGRKRGKFLYEIFIKDILPVFPNIILFMISDYCMDHPNVIHIQNPSDFELANLLRQSWLFTYPSNYEGFGIPYVEAMASGTATITSPNEGSKYILDEGEYGSIVEDALFGQEILRLLGDPEQRIKYQKDGLRRVQMFSWNSVAKAHIYYYREAMAIYSGKVLSPMAKI